MLGPGAPGLGEGGAGLGDPLAPEVTGALRQAPGAGRRGLPITRGVAGCVADGGGEETELCVHGSSVPRWYDTHTMTLRNAPVRPRCWAPVGAFVVTAVTALLLALALAPAQAQETPPATDATTTTAAPPVVAVQSAADLALEPGDLLIVETGTGSVRVLRAPGGTPDVLVSGLQNPSGVAVLGDGTIVIAETGADRVVAVGGRFGTTLTTVASLPTPDGLSARTDGTVMVSSFFGDQLGVVNVDQQRYDELVQLARPGIPYVLPEGGQTGTVLITQGALGELSRVEGTTVVPIATGLDAPYAALPAPGGGWFVTEFRKGEVVKINTDGSTGVFATVPDARQLALRPGDGDTFTLLVSTPSGVVQIDQTGAQTGTIPLDRAAGMAFVPDTVQGATPSGSLPTAVTTEVPPATVPTSSGGSGSGLWVIIAVLALVAVAGAAAVVWFTRRPGRTMVDAGFDEVDLDTTDLHTTFGPCAAQEIELSQAQSALDSLLVQRRAAERRLAEAVETVAEAKAELAERTSAHEAATARRRAGKAPTGTAAVLTIDDLGLQTPQGREAFVRFRAGDLDAAALATRWRELGEHRAIEVVAALGDPDDERSWEERETSRREHAARIALEGAQTDLADATADIERLAEREAEAKTRVEEAEKALALCRGGAEGEEHLLAREEDVRTLAAALRAEPEPEPEVEDESDADEEPEADAGADAPPTESKAEEKKAPVVAPKPSPAPAPTPKPEPAPAPKVQQAPPKPAPQQAPPQPKAAPAPMPQPEPEPKPEPLPTWEPPAEPLGAALPAEAPRPASSGPAVDHAATAALFDDVPPAPEKPSGPERLSAEDLFGPDDKPTADDGPSDPPLRFS